MLKNKIDSIFYNGYDIQFYEMDDKYQFVIIDSHNKNIVHQSEFYETSNVWKDAYDFLNKQVFD